MKSSEIRKQFLDYFARHGHEVVPSSSLVPANDPTLLFTNAGMVQFKETFLGIEKRPYRRAVSSQRCVRAGGKHNDLENVGYTARHHTFFEMLGNFSFGDYFKRDAIQFAWEFLTQEMKLSPEKLWITVYKDDAEAADIWLKEIGVSPDRFSRLGKKDNFWSMGDTGPCGPCSEIFYDHGADVTGGPPGTSEEDGDRYVEIWNLVFMQFNRDAKGKMTDLPEPSVDTGMGLERLAAVKQGVQSNYQIDLFKNLIKSAASILNIRKHLQSHSLQVIADHIRSTSFLIIDGVFPSNEGRGYVLRRIIRRAIRHGHQLGAKDVFFYRLVKPLIGQMGDAYPELAKNRSQIEKVLRQEEERFVETLEKGLKILDQDIDDLSGDTIAGSTIFQLYDTFGFPVDLTADIARERSLKLDMEGFNKEMEQQRDRARAASSFKTADIADSEFTREKTTEFTGYDNTEDTAVVEAIQVDGKPRNSLAAGEQGIVYLNQTSFYAESGGQAGDQGWLHTNKMIFRVEDTVKGYAHVGLLEKGKLKVGDKITCEVDASRRQATAYNHSATHLMHAALKKVLGDHVQQKGSLVTPERLRFDFSHLEPVTHDQLYEIELIVNEQVRANETVETRVMGLTDAKKSGAVALFGEKYGEQVRVVGMGDFSVELCGGTHVSRTGDIGIFKVVSEGGVAAGVRRIEAVTGEAALGYLSETDDRLMEIAGLVKGSREDVRDKVKQLTHRLRAVDKELEQLKAKLASSQGDNLTDKAVEVEGIHVLAVRLDGMQTKELRDTLDRLKDKLGSAAIVLATVDAEKVSLVAGVTKDLVKRLHAGKLVGEVAARVGGKGGGRADMAQAGGKNPAELDSALAAVPDWIRQQLIG
ncbi:MAG: alanine--tRNA ligase [Acidiferrobacterales bacterium]